MVEFKGRGISGKKADMILMDECSNYLTKGGEIRRRKFAPVVPFNFYQQFLIHGYVPDSILLLAHDVVAHPKEYQEIFADARWSRTTIFMDNSLVELKKAVDIEMVAEAVSIVSLANQVVVICPDVMAESQASQKATLDAWPEWSWRFREYKKLVVLQGESIRTFLETAEVLEDLDPDWVSIPRVTEQLFGYHRRELIPYVKAIYPRANLHLLGFSDYIWEDLRAVSHPAVQSIDSAVPFRMKTLNVLSEKVEKRDPNWFETAQFSKDCLERVEVIDDLIWHLEAR